MIPFLHWIMIIIIIIIEVLIIIIIIITSISAAVLHLCRLLLRIVKHEILNQKNYRFMTFQL
jgi:hypothetical protein